MKRKIIILSLLFVLFLLYLFNFTYVFRSSDDLLEDALLIRKEKGAINMQSRDLLVASAEKGNVYAQMILSAVYKDLGSYGSREGRSSLFMEKSIYWDEKVKKNKTKKFL